MEMKYQSHVAKEEMETYPLYVYAGNVFIIEDKDSLSEAVEFLSNCSCMGFDTETRPAFHKGESYKVGLLQLAAQDRVYLFRLNKCGFDTSLMHLLANPEILKIGVGIRDDIRSLRKLGVFLPAAFVDMQDYAALYGIEDKSFSKLMAIIFHVRISKRQRVSNWDAESLSEAQIRYAATDAWGALKMYEQLKLDKRIDL